LPTRSGLAVLFALLVGVPVGAAVYLGQAGLERERAMLVERERTSLERRADEVRDALVRRLQELYRDAATAQWGAADAPVISDRFQVHPDRTVTVQGAAVSVPPDIETFAQSVTAENLLRAPPAADHRQSVEVGGGGGAGGGAAWGTPFVYFEDLAARGVGQGNRVELLEGFRIDPEQISRRYLDPASPETVLNRFDERIERAELVRDDARLLVHGTSAHGLPRVIYRSPVPARRGDDPVLLPPGYLLALSVHPAASLARDLEAAGESLWWTLFVMGVIVLLGMVFVWRAVRAESRLAARKAEFVSAVSHELRTPLTSIRMYADMLKEGWVDDVATAKEYVGLISAESERLARLVNNVLDFSRIEKGRKTFAMQVGDPAPVVRETAEVLRPYLKEKGFELVLDVPEKLGACTFDRDALVQILVNLIDNAVRHGAGEVRLEAEARDGRVALRVLDRGPGVPEEERESIFEPFARGRAARGAGSGLGLALVRHYALAHHGTISVAPRPGGGSVFALDLPAS